MEETISLANLVKCDDSIRFKLYTQRVIAQEDVLLSLQVHSLLSTHQIDQVELLHRIRESLNKFIKAEWAFSTIQRAGESVGYERVVVDAAARVHSGEVFNLADRASKASSEGLSLREPKANYSLPANRVSEIVRELQIETIQSVNSQIINFDAATKRHWRIGNLTFGVWDQNNSETRSSKGAYRSSDNSVADLMFNQSGSTITGTEKIALVAEVELRSVATD